MSLPAARSRSLHLALLLNLTVSALLAAFLCWMFFTPGASEEPMALKQRVPHSTAMESATGIRFSRVAVVGDGGLLTVFYVVLDSEKATVFQADRDHPPKLRSEVRQGGTQRASIMRAGHQMRAGQTYYLVYEDTKGAIRPGERVTISYGDRTLRHVPVL